MLKTRTKKRAWNKDKTVGQRRPFTPREVQVIRYAIEREQNGRDLALFNTAMDTLLRSSHLLALKVEDVTNPMGEVCLAGSPRLQHASSEADQVEHGV